MHFKQILVSAFLTLLLLFSLFVYADGENGSFASNASRKYCETILRSLIEADSIDLALEQVDQLESAYSILQSEFPDKNLSSIKSRIDEITDLALTNGSAVAVRGNAEKILREMMALFPPIEVELQQSRETLPSIENLIMKPESITANVRYRSAHEHLVVIFSEDAISDISEVDQTISTKLFRAIQKGFVGAHSGPGIYRATDVHKSFFEVKCKGGDRLIGCLNSGVLHVKKLISKRNEGKGGSLAAFKAVCR